MPPGNLLQCVLRYQNPRQLLDMSIQSCLAEGERAYRGQTQQVSHVLAGRGADTWMEPLAVQSALCWQQCRRLVFSLQRHAADAQAPCRAARLSAEDPH